MIFPNKMVKIKHILTNRYMSLNKNSSGVMVDTFTGWNCYYLKELEQDRFRIHSFSSQILAKIREELGNEPKLNYKNKKAIKGYFKEIMRFVFASKYTLSQLQD